MGTYKKEDSRKKREVASGEKKMVRVKGENFYRDAKKIQRLNMLKGGKPVRDRRGKIVKAAQFQEKRLDSQMARVAPNKKWFGKDELDVYSI
jgi:nuclear GTP-binding protein